jgi:phosphoglycolate phosphatase
LNLTNKKLIIFDLDGTLVDSAPDLALAVNHTLETIGRASFPSETIRSWVGNGAETLVRRALSGSTRIDETLDETKVSKALEIFLKFYADNLCVETVAYDNVKTTLYELHDEAFRLAIVTNKPYDFVEPLLKGLGLDSLFEKILGGDSLAKKKPDAMPLLHVCKKLDVSVDDTLMVGDSKNDIVAAKNANMQSVGVSYGYNYNEDISTYEPEHVIDDFKTLLTLVKVAT